MLDQEQEKLLEETYKIEKENNEMLRDLHSSMMWGRFFKIFYWILILGLMFGSFYFIQPYIEKAMNTYNTATKLLPGGSQ